MSRLDSFIRRMKAQRTCLNWAASEVADLPGPVFELGLGNGRTYDHLRETLPDRDIYVFEKVIKAHPNCIPPDDRLFLGDAIELLPVARQRLGEGAALVHTDLGTGDDAANRELAAQLAKPLANALRPGGIVLANIEIPVAAWTRQPEPEGVQKDRYFLYRG
ncbi:MAG: class I SAM-dependent methyltransferase [Pseudomonadota bacterium]